jgi:hypothetical protein
MDNKTSEQSMRKKISPVAFPSFQSRVHSVHTTLKTSRKKMSANPHAGILYRKSYNMRRPIFASILLPLPTHAQNNASGFAQKSENQFLPASKPHAQKLLRQFLRHLPTHHPEIEIITTMTASVEETEIWKETAERKEARMAWHYIQRAVLRDCGSNPADNSVQISKLLPRRKFSGSRNHAKPQERCTLWHDKKKFFVKNYYTKLLIFK